VNIITSEVTEKERLLNAQLDAQAYGFYDSSPEVRKLADKIHTARMLTGPACPDCIRAAIRQIQE
jgi:hypothetical protein